MSLSYSLSAEDFFSIYPPHMKVAPNHHEVAALANLVVERYHAQQYLYAGLPDACPFHKMPYIIGVAGGISSGKSTMSNDLQKILALRFPQKRVAILALDHFLYPEKTRIEKKILAKKGFPATYDHKNIVTVLEKFQQGKYPIKIPSYSHTVYDTIPDGEIFQSADILILEGLHVLHVQSKYLPLSDFCHISIYVDASLEDLQFFYQKRFLSLVVTAKPNSHYHAYAHMSKEEKMEKSLHIWESINKLNIAQNILPFRERAHIIWSKDREHALKFVALSC